MDPGRFRKRFLTRLVASPWVGVPAGLGLASLGLGIVLGHPLGFFGFMGVVGILLGVGMGATRWVLGYDQIARQAFEEVLSETERSHYAFLDGLEKRLHGDGDPRTIASVRDLRKIYRRLERAGMVGEGGSGELLPEIRDHSVELYESCVESLERTLAFWNAAQEMATREAREKLLRSREELLAEIRQSIHHLGATLDHLQTAALQSERPGQELSEMRRELEMGLEVARRVSSRMDQLERGVREGEPEPSGP